MRLTHGQVTGGGLAVDSFFVMSGFLIAGSAERSAGVWSFLRKRVARIYPAFLVLTAVSLLVFLPLSGGRLAEGNWLGDAGDVGLQTLRLTEFHYAGVFAGNAYPGVINGSVWSIAYEFWCYVGVAGLLMYGWLRRKNLLLGLLGAAWVWSLVSQVRHWKLGGKWVGVVLGSPQFWARLLVLYLAGVVFYSLRERIMLKNWLAGVAAAAMLGACFVSWGWTATFPFAGTYLLFWFAFTPGIRLRSFGKFGDFSYGTYLYAFPIEQLLVKAWGGSARPGVLFACATPLALLAAVGSWYGVERRFLGHGRKKEVAMRALEEQLGVGAR